MAEENGEVIKIQGRRKKQKVEIELENGEVRKYTLVELVGVERDSYVSFLAGKQKGTDKDGNSIYHSYERIHSSLLAKCLIREDDGKPENEDFIQKNFSSSCIVQLYEMAVKLSGFDKEASLAAKNG